LEYHGSTKFSAKSRPGRFEKVAIYPDADAEDDDGLAVEIKWTQQ
jgi:hypothetical protein